MAKRDQLIEIFQDTEAWYQENPVLAEAVRKSIAGTVLYPAAEYPAIRPAKDGVKTEVTVTKARSFEAAVRLLRDNPGKKAAVHNFASATNPGGGVTLGSGAQEECLCRCSTLYPVLNTQKLWEGYYSFHRKRHDVRYTDACIYSPDIVIIKSDTPTPMRLPENAWRTVDVITCAAPNLRPRPNNPMNPGQDKAVQVSDAELLELHRSRARHMLAVAAAHGADILVLGAFGCGAFRNKPEIVAQAYREILPEFAGVFSKIEFAVYCSSRDRGNYDAFCQALG
ncbi:MAG: TIGR02452 family protein [Oscillospiraceae bacterium]|nr:TIGR02452 family protein [Oscillospiraceae bacterium]